MGTNLKGGKFQFSSSLIPPCPTTRGCGNLSNGILLSSSAGQPTPGSMSIIFVGPQKPHSINVSVVYLILDFCFCLLYYFPLKYYQHSIYPIIKILYYISFYLFRP